jgi:hypothetical protein
MDFKANSKENTFFLEYSYYLRRYYFFIDINFHYSLSSSDCYTKQTILNILI